MPQTDIAPDYAENITRELLADAWRSRWAIVLFTVLLVSATAAASFFVPKKYEAVLVFMPASNGPGSGGLSSLAAAAPQLGGLASLAGVSLGGSNNAKIEALATLQSEALTQRYIENNHLLPILFKKDWDAKQQRWISNDPKKIPTLWKAKQYFRLHVRDVKENAKTSLTTLTITWYDPQLAAQWANGLIDLTNDYLRQKTIKETERNIEYLNEQLAKTSVVAIRDSIYSLMESEIKKQMMARGTEEFALKVIDPAVPPEKAASPNKPLWVAAAFCASLLLSGAYLFIRVLYRGEDNLRIKRNRGK